MRNTKVHLSITLFLVLELCTKINLKNATKI